MYLNVRAWGVAGLGVVDCGSEPRCGDVTAPTQVQGALLLLPARMTVRKYRQVNLCLSFGDVTKPKLAVRKERFSSPRHAKQMQC